jgi:hypothetical protein
MPVAPPRFTVCFCWADDPGVDCVTGRFPAFEFWHRALSLGAFCFERMTSRSISRIWFYTASLILPMMIHLSGEGRLLVVQGASIDTVSKPNCSAVAASSARFSILSTTISRLAGLPVDPLGNASTRNLRGSFAAFRSTDSRAFQELSLAVLHFFLNSLFNCVSASLSSGSIFFLASLSLSWRSLIVPDWFNPRNVHCAFHQAAGFFSTCGGSGAVSPFEALENLGGKNFSGWHHIQSLPSGVLHHLKCK